MVPVRQAPKAQGVRALDAKSRLEDGQRHDEVAGQNDTLLEVHTQTVGRTAGLGH